jgi:hypothetical protein
MTKIALISTGAGILVGAVAGYLYYRYIGCNSGTVSSHPNRLIPLYMEYDGRFSFQHVCKNEKK